MTLILYSVQVHSRCRAHGPGSSLGGPTSAGPGLTASDGGAPVLPWQDVTGGLGLHRPQVLTSALVNLTKNIIKYSLDQS